MSKKGVVLGLFAGLVLSTPHLAQTKSSLRMIPIKITSNGRFVPDRIVIKQDEKIVFRVTAVQSNELTWPPGVLHGFYLMYDNIVLIGKIIETKSDKIDRVTVEVKWTPKFAGEFTLRCPFHKHKTGTVIVK